jgi:hypothetical protein
VKLPPVIVKPEELGKNAIITENLKMACRKVNTNAAVQRAAKGQTPLAKHRLVDCAMDIFPVEIWHLIFSFACLDDGSTGRSLSLVSTHFREISAPFKYQSIAVTHWSQIITFSQFFCKLPAFQKKTVALFVHHPYPFLDVDGYPNPSRGTHQRSDDLEHSEESEDIQEIRDGLALLECNDGDDVIEALDVESLFARDNDLKGGLDRSGSDDGPWDNNDSIWDSDGDLKGGSDRSGSDDGRWHNNDSEWDSEFEGSLDSEEEKEILEDAEYLEGVRDGRLTSDGNTRDDDLRDADIQAFFDNVLQAFHAVLNEISSTLQVLAVYWNSFEPLPMHEILPVLPCLIELHINRSSLIKDFYEDFDLPTTVLFPQLKFLYISGDNPRMLSFSDELARVAPNLAFLRFSMAHFQ